MVAQTGLGYFDSVEFELNKSASLRRIRNFFLNIRFDGVSSIFLAFNLINAVMNDSQFSGDDFRIALNITNVEPESSIKIIRIEITSLHWFLRNGHIVCNDPGTKIDDVDQNQNSNS
ncbi:hypothetical protein DERP_004982 [Dermatophagoides pteronyssinus]|uniref:Uncharacterized protein n=1 Tax=Dermatophagoides pteronyssinus TaxID=6956 RepID=A0ABQ8JT32_DERPT|nr:hypothetical protein DERP_004982 [Dermatophagoides pteronyssinus]